MGDYKVAIEANASSDGNFANPRTNKAQELVVPDFWLQLAIEGKLFMAGDGIEGTHEDSKAALDDTTPTFILKAPGDGTIVVPLEMSFSLTTEGGAAPDIDLTYVQENIVVSTAGTDLGALNCLGGSDAPTSKALAQLNPVLAAITSAQNVMVKSERRTLDNYISVEAATTVVGVIKDFGEQASLRWRPVHPVALYKGSMIAVYPYTGTSDAKWSYHMVWAELPSAARK